MEGKHFLLLCATLTSFYWLSFAQEASGGSRRVREVPRTRFTCVGRASGYYADMATGCQVYHMCDGLGRQFSYTCPNTTLFQQRMLVCDHWYMVNCSMAERDYSANLLIGQRDKPFVSDEEMRLWTPRPDILTVPANTNYYDGLKEAETKYSTHPGNSIVGIPDSISTLNNNGLDSAKINYRPPSSWSTGTGRRPKPDQTRPNQKPNQDQPTNQDLSDEESQDNLAGASQKAVPTFKPVRDDFTQNSNTDFSQNANTDFTQSTGADTGFTGNNNSGFTGSNSGFTRSNSGFTGSNSAFTPASDFNQDTSFTQINTASTFRNTVPNVTPPTQDLRPPFSPTTETSEEFQIDARMKEPKEDAVIKFINRFDPNSPDSIKTSMTRSEILDINKQLPAGQTSSEDDRERTSRRQKIKGSSINNVQGDNKKAASASRFDTVNTKPATQPTIDANSLDFEVKTNQIPAPNKELQPPKNDYSKHTGTTMGPPIYYEWKWAAPAFDLEPPKATNDTYNGTSSDLKPEANVRSPFSRVTRPTPVDLDPIAPTKNTEYNISSYFVPDYIFPLDKPHPGYDSDDAQSSFQVEAARPGRSYGENPNCPQCHPAYLNPGSCEPCIVKR